MENSHSNYVIPNHVPACIIIIIYLFIYSPQDLWVGCSGYTSVGRSPPEYDICININYL